MTAYDLHTASDTVIIGEAVTANSLSEYAYRKYGKPLTVICPPDTDSECLYHHMISGENRLRELLSGTKKVIADPMFKPICPENAEFTDFPHEAFSGRIYREKIPNLMRNVK